jgi:hypothetical protein
MNLARTRRSPFEGQAELSELVNPKPFVGEYEILYHREPPRMQDRTADVTAHLE